MAGTESTKMCVTVRWANRSDMRRIAEIEEESFGSPWLPEVISWSISRTQSVGLVAEWQGEIVGYAIYYLRPSDTGSAIQVHRLAVASFARRSGIGGCLLDNMIGRLTQERSELIFPVRESNLLAQLWLREYGLECTEIINGYYADDEDAYIFTLSFKDLKN